MPYLNPEARDQGLDWIDVTGTRLHICSQEPTTYNQANATYSLGDAAVNVPAPTTSGGARGVVVPAVSGGAVDGTGSWTHWAITNASNTLVAAGALDAPVAVTAGGTFSTASFVIRYGTVTEF